jgi:hypothetical protein
MDGTEILVNLTAAELLAAALKAERPADPSWHRALDKALQALYAEQWWALQGETLLIVSASDEHVIHRASLTDCSCPARGLCYHQALLCLLLAYTAFRFPVAPLKLARSARVRVRAA